MKKNENTVKLSYIVPCYNVQDYLPRCLDSLFSQKTLDGYNVELILVNDGSTDTTLSLLREFCKKEPRAVIIDQNNQGVSAARNAGLRVAQGEYVYFLDGDDYLTEDASRIICEQCDKYTPDILIANAYIVQEGKWDVKKEWNPCLGIDAGIYKTVEFAKIVNQMPISFKIYRRKLLNDYNITYDSDLRVGEVYTFFLHAMTHSDNIAFTDKRILNYVKRKSGVMRSINFERDSTIINTMHRVDMYAKKYMPELLDLPSYQITLFNIVNMFGMSNYAKKTSFSPDVRKMMNLIRSDDIYRKLRRNHFKRILGINKKTMSFVFFYYFPVSISFRLLHMRYKYKSNN